MAKISEIIGLVIGALLLVALLALIEGWFIMLLWNWLVPVMLPGLVSAGYIAGSITYLEGFGLATLCGLLFTSASSGSSSKSK